MSKDEEAPLVSSERLRALPTLPGVYLMKAADGKVIYVGKAKNLRNRVRSYFSGGDGRQSIPFLLRRIVDIETVVTQDEKQALVLENDLIKTHTPRYNIRLKDDKAHLIVRIDLNKEWPSIELVRKERSDGARYIGPFAFGYELKILLEVIRNSVTLRTCSDRVLMNRVRPCLEYQIKRCAGPCCLPVNRAEYLEWVDEAIKILEGRGDEVIEMLENKMLTASQQLRFEEAALIRDQIQALENAKKERPPQSFSDGAKDAIGLHYEGERAEISILQVRHGRLRNAKTFGFEDLKIPDEELLSSFLSQYYSNGEEIPSEIYLPFNLEDVEAREALYSEKCDAKVQITVPQKGEKHRLILLAQENARENFLARFGATAGEGDVSLRALKDELGLEQIPRMVECVDISHFQGGSTVASVVHFKDARPDKNRYRTFILDSQEGKPDDFASMFEVVERHLSRCAEENTLPDLMVIDGGAAQLSEALQVRSKLGLNQPTMIGLAKKRGIKQAYYSVVAGEGGFYKPERVYVEGKSGPIVLRENSKGLFLLERLRDEAHRFAITFHRARRTKSVFKSPLDGVMGLGQRRRNILLREFGSIARIRNTTAEQITDKTGIPLKVAKAVIEKLNRSQGIEGEEPN